MNDLAIFGKTESDKKIFVAVEAKIDKPFGITTQNVFFTAKAKQMSGGSTNAPEHIEEQIKLNFPKPDISVFDVRY